MPSRPPKLRPEPQRQAWGHGGKARQQRGYDRAHERMRELLMREVVVCEACRRSGRVTLGTIADHVKPLAHGGSGKRDNYQLLCRSCSDAKTLADKLRRD